MGPNLPRARAPPFIMEKRGELRASRKRKNEWHGVKKPLLARERRGLEKKMEIAEEVSPPRNIEEGT